MHQSIQYNTKLTALWSGGSQRHICCWYSIALHKCLLLGPVCGNTAVQRDQLPTLSPADAAGLAQGASTAHRERDGATICKDTAAYYKREGTMEHYGEGTMERTLSRGVDKFFRWFFDYSTSNLVGATLSILIAYSYTTQCKIIDARNSVSMVFKIK